jgi:hypothetical protein
MEGDRTQASTLIRRMHASWLKTTLDLQDWPLCTQTPTSSYGAASLGLVNARHCTVSNFQLQRKAQIGTISEEGFVPFLHSLSNPPRT